MRAALQILVLGQGRFGRLWAQLLRPLGDVLAYDLNAQPSTGSPHIAPVVPLLPNQEALYQAIQTCDALFFCIPISGLQDCLLQLQGSLADRRRSYHRDRVKALWMMDTCSVKERPMAWLKEAIQAVESTSKPEEARNPVKASGSLRFLGLHPMFGPDSVSLLPHGGQSAPMAQVEGLNLVLCPAVDGLSPWQQHFASLGFQTLVMSAKEHDCEAARTQGLTHLLGRVLESFDIRESPIATAGYRALCQLREQTCHDTWQLFLDLQKQNRYTPLMRLELQKALESVYTTLETGTLRG